MEENRSDLALPHSPVRSHDEVARIMTAAGERMTRQAVAQAERVALRKLRVALVSHGVFFEDLDPRG